MTADHALSARRRVVVDTNVWISAALVNDAAPGQVVRFVLDRGMPILSKATFAELESRLWRPKFDRYLNPQQRNQLLRDLSGAAEWVEPSADLTMRGWCRDPDDDKFVHAALAGKAGWLVTGDADLLTLASVETVQVISPAQALLIPGFCTGNS